MRHTSILLAATLIFSLRAMAALHDVGIIPGPGGCPSGSERITIFMDDEDGPHSADAHSGWIGAIYQDINTRFEFCRVDGDLFANVDAGPFAVLQLSSDCPNGAQSFGRLFENERDDFNGNDNNHTSSYGYGIVPNQQDDHFTYLKFCFFNNPLQAFTAPTWFPELGLEYGVFASKSDLRDAPDYGEMLTDDEDGNVFAANRDDFDGPDYFVSPMRNIVLANGGNTELHFAKVRPYCFPKAVLRINGVSGSRVSITGPQWPIVVDGSHSTCNAGAYFVSIQLSDANWGRYNNEEMLWLTASDGAYGDISHFDMRRFAEDRYFIFVPGQYYRIKLAVGPRWDEANTLIYIQPQSIDWRRRAVPAGPPAW